MDPPSVATSASDAAALGVQLAQDLYRLASDHPSVECQIGRIAQAFVDLNLALADLACALLHVQTPVSLSTQSLDLIDALVGRIHGVQKTFRTNLNDDAPIAGKASGSGQKKAKQPQPPTTKLGRLKTLFPGPGAAERFTEMEWMRNTLALLTAVLRLSMTTASGNVVDLLKEPGLRIASETLTSAVLIYVRMVEQKLAGPDEDDEDASDDEEPITGPGSLLFVAAPPPAPNVTAKGKASLSKKKEVATQKLDAATWVYEALCDRVKESDRAQTLPAQFIEWLLHEVVVVKTKESPETAESADKADDAVEVEATAAPEPEPEVAAVPVYLSKKAAKKAAKLKGKAAATAAKAPESEVQADNAQDDKPASTSDDKASAIIDKEAEKLNESASAPGSEAKDKAPTADAAPVADAPDAGQSPSAEHEKAREARFGSRHGIDPDHDDLPPPYPSPDAFMPHSRGPPFVAPPFPFAPGNSMPYPPPPGVPFDEYANMAYMHPRPAMFHSVGFYPVHPPYMASQPFFGPRGAGHDVYGLSADHYDGQPQSGRPGPGMRRGSIERPHRDAPDGPRGGLVPRRRPAGTVLNSAVFEDEPFDDDIPANRRRSLQNRRRRESDESQETSDSKGNEPTYANNDKENSTSAEKENGATAPESEMSLERVVYRPKKQIAGPSKQSKKSGNAKAAMRDNDSENDVEDDENLEHYSDAETIDIRDIIASNSGKKRTAKNSSVKEAAQPSKGSSPPPVTVLPTPPTPPTAIEEEEDDAGESGAKAKPISKAKLKAKTKAKKGAAKAKVEPEIEEHGEDKEIKESDAKDKGDSEYESAHENNDDDQHPDSDVHEDDETETRFSPDTEHRVFTPPPTPPDAPPHPGEAPIPPPPARLHPEVQHHGPPPPGAGVPGGLGGMPYFAQPPFMQQQHPMMGANPFHPQQHPNADMGVGMGMGFGMGMGAGGAAAMDPLWASFLSESMGIPPSAAPWATAAAAAAATAAAATAVGMNGIRAAPAAAAAGVNSSWIRGDNHQFPVNGKTSQPASRPQPPSASRPQQWSRYRSRGMHRDEQDDRGAYYPPSEDDEYGDYDRDDYDSPPMNRGARPPYAQYTAPRRRSHSPPYQRPQRQYHQPQPPPPQQQQQQQRHQHYRPDDSPPGGGVWSRDEKTSPPNQPYEYSGAQQQYAQQQYRNAYNAYYDQPRRESFSQGHADWGWPGDMKQPPPTAQHQHQHQHQHSQQTPQMPPLHNIGNNNNNNSHQPVWDDGWNETYRQSRGHAEFAMTEIDG